MRLSATPRLPCEDRSITELSNTQRKILTTACERKGFVLPLTVNVKGGALTKVLTSLLSKGLIEEVPAGKQEVWGTTDGAPLTPQGDQGGVRR